MDRFVRKVGSSFSAAPGLKPTESEKRPVGRPPKRAREDAVSLGEKREVVTKSELAQVRAELAGFKAELAKLRGGLQPGTSSEDPEARREASAAAGPLLLGRSCSTGSEASAAAGPLRLGRSLSTDSLETLRSYGSWGGRPKKVSSPETMSKPKQFLSASMNPQRRDELIGHQYQFLKFVQKVLSERGLREEEATLEFFKEPVS